MDEEIIIPFKEEKMEVNSTIRNFIMSEFKSNIQTEDIQMIIP